MKPEIERKVGTIDLTSRNLSTRTETLEKVQVMTRLKGLSQMTLYLGITLTCYIVRPIQIKSAFAPHDILRHKWKPNNL